MAVLLFLASTLLTTCKDKDSSTGPVQNGLTTLELIQANSQLTTFARLIEGTPLAGQLTNTAGITVFAPSNAAFDQLPDGYLEGLSEQELLDLLRYHCYLGDYPVMNEIKREQITSLQGDPLFMEIGQSFGNLVNNKATFGTTNIVAANGRIHIIDAVLKPDQQGNLADNIGKRYEYRIFYSRLQEAGLMEFLETPGPKTLLATSDAAFELYEAEGYAWDPDQWKEILEYHMLAMDLTDFGTGTRTALATVSGDSVYLTVDEPGKYNLNSTSTDPVIIINATNGKIMQSPGLALPDKYMGVLPLADKRFYLTTIRSALAAARMTGRLYNSDNNVDEQFTIFMPHNGAAGINNLPLEETVLANLLQYHVLLEKVTSDQLQDGQAYTTWQGEELTIQRAGNVITINGTATIMLADLEGTNGVVHVINGTLTPPAN